METGCLEALYNKSKSLTLCPRHKAPERVPHTPPTLGKEPRVGCGVGRWLFGSKEQLSCQQTEFSEYDKMVITDVKIRVAFSANSTGSLSNLIFESPRN